MMVLVNDDNAVTLLQRSETGGAEGPRNAFGVFYLNAGDNISMRIEDWNGGVPWDGSIEFWFNSNHAYFGAFLI